MKRILAPLTLIAALSVLTSACEKAGATEEQRELRANERAAAARNQAEQNAAAAQAEADKEIAAAQTEFAKTRENYRHSRWMDIADLDKKMVDLEAREQTTSGKTRADLAAVLPTIRAKRDRFVRDMQTLDSVTGVTWDAAKSNLDKEWDGLKATAASAP
jgi:hypothetical protein